MCWANKENGMWRPFTSKHTQKHLLSRLLANHLCEWVHNDIIITYGCLFPERVDENSYTNLKTFDILF